VDLDGWVPKDIDTERPSPARMYDYLLGGAHNFAIDRDVAEQILAAFPNAPKLAQVNRAFLRRAVEFFVQAGIRQFLDIGSGVPTVGHVHEIAQAAAPESRVVFVDIDPVAVEHSRLILEGNDLTAVVHEDIRHPERILAAPEVRRLMDLTQPVAVLMVAMLHYVTDADGPASIVSRLTERLAAGSYLALSHPTNDGVEDWSEVGNIAGRAGIEGTSRSKTQVEAIFAGLELVEPGVVWVSSWRPESPNDLFVDQPQASGWYAAVGRKR
jgi:SAM-dependent methyltransferase